MRRVNRTALVLLYLPLASAVVCAQDSPSSSADAKSVDDSAAGLQEQFRSFLQIIRSGDQAGVQSSLDSFAIPNPASWFPTHFDPVFAPKLVADYANAFAGIRSHIWWATGTFAKFSDFSYVVQSSALPNPVANIGFESLLPRPNAVVQIENFRINSAAPDSSHGPPSWVSSFVFIDGRFRWVGGTYPFWTEGLSAFRGPMSLPPVPVRGRIIQAVAFRDDQKGSGIEAIVHVEMKVERDGRISKIKFLSGDKEFLKDAEDYLNAQRFSPLPNDPRLANAKRKWKMEVAFFLSDN